MLRQPKLTAITPKRNSIQPASDFLSLLPSEIRLQIYEYVFEHEVVEVKRERYPAPKEFGGPAPPLLMTCRQIYLEGLKIYWKSITVEAEFSVFHSASPLGFTARLHLLDLWLNRLGSRREKMLTKVKLSLDKDQHPLSRDRRSTDPSEPTSSLAELGEDIILQTEQRTLLKREALLVEFALRSGFVMWTSTPWDDAKGWEAFLERWRKNEVEKISSMREDDLETYLDKRANAEVDAGLLGEGEKWMREAWNFEKREDDS